MVIYNVISFVYSMYEISQPDFYLINEESGMP